MKISIVLLHYNRKNLLIKTLDSIMNSSVSKNDLEVILIDDASVEEHSIKEIDSLFPELKFKTHFFNYEEKWWLCPVIPLNKGISMATGDVVVLLCGECMLIGDVILDIKQRIKPNDYLVYATLSLTKEETHNISSLSYSEVLNLNPEGHMWYQHSVHHNSQLNFCTAICKSDLDELGGFDERYGWGVDFGDVDFLQRIKRKGMNITSIDNPLTYHQHHEKVIYIETAERRHKFPPKNQIVDKKLYDYVLANEPNNIKVVNSFTSMKVDKIIFSVDDNPDYEGFWEINSEICEKKLGITPILFRITDHESDFEKSKFGYVKNVKSLEGVNTGFQAQIYRMYGTKYFPNEVCITSDIDMLLFSKDYINEKLKDATSDDLVIFNSDAYDESRPECIGIHSGPDRYPICYCSAKGSTFTKIIKNDVSFEDYCNRLLDLELGWDTDEIYFGKCVNNQTEVNIIKVSRGYSTNFYCPNRIEKHNFYNSGIFSIDLEKKINLDSFIDCHCARPYNKFKSQIDNIKKVILNEMNEIYLIGCHIENETQENLLRELTNQLISHNKKFILTSHTTIPNDIVEKSVGFIYDSVNPKYNTWELDGFSTFTFESEYFNLVSPYISYGASQYYHVGVIRLFINALKYLQNLDFDVVHWMEYDSFYDSELEENSNLLLRDHDFIFYGVGTKFSFRLNKVNPLFLQMNNNQILEKLRENQFLAEKLLKSELISGKIKNFIFDETITNQWGRYSQNFNTMKINWSLYENNQAINLFLNNITSEEQVADVHINDTVVNYKMTPHTWYTIDISGFGSIKNFKILNCGKVLVDTDLTIAKNYNNIIGKVKFSYK